MVSADASAAAEELSAEERSDSRRRVLFALLIILALIVVTLWIIFSQTVTVPDLVGLTEEVARETLADAGLETGDVTSEPSSEVKAGEVASQSPEGGRRVLRGEAIDLAVASGTPTVPGGETGDRSSGSDTSGYGNYVIPGGAADQPAGSSSAPASGGTGPTVPFVLNMEKGVALAALRAAGYRAVVGGYGPTTAGVLEGRVYYQNPAPDVPVARGTAVTIWISTGPPHEDGYEGVPYPEPP